MGFITGICGVMSKHGSCLSPQIFLCDKNIQNPLVFFSLTGKYALSFFLFTLLFNRM